MDQRIREVVRGTNEWMLIKKVLDDPSIPSTLLVAATGAVSRLVLSPQLVKAFSKQAIIPSLVSYMNHDNIKVHGRFGSLSWPSTNKHYLNITIIIIT